MKTVSILLLSAKCFASTLSLSTTTVSDLPGGGFLTVDVTHIYDDESFLLVDSAHSWSADAIQFEAIQTIEIPGTFPDPPTFIERVVSVTGQLLNLPNTSNYQANYLPSDLHFNGNQWEFGGYLGVHWDAICSLCPHQENPEPVYVELTMVGPSTTATEVLELYSLEGTVGGSFTNILVDNQWQPVKDYAGKTLMSFDTTHDGVFVSRGFSVLSPIVTPEPTTAVMLLFGFLCHVGRRHPRTRCTFNRTRKMGRLT